MQNHENPDIRIQLSYPDMDFSLRLQLILPCMQANAFALLQAVFAPQIPSESAPAPTL